MTVKPIVNPPLKRITGLLGGPNNQLYTYINDTTGVSKDYTNYKWGSRYVGEGGVTVSYKFPTALPPIYQSRPDSFKQSFEAMTAEEQSVVRVMFQDYSNVANIQFVEATAANDYGQISLMIADDGGSQGMSEVTPMTDADYSFNGRSKTESTPGIYFSTSFFHQRFADGSMIKLDDYRQWVMRHEIGHALGLSHPAPSAGFGLDRNNGYFDTSAEVDLKYTIMAYSSDLTEFNGTGISNTSMSPTGLQLYDIATLQYLYGVNTTYHTGNDVYKFGKRSTTAGYQGGYNEAIWDAGGVDTLDISEGVQAPNASFVNQLDLREGKASRFITGFYNSFGTFPVVSVINIAYGAIIENAIGSNFADNIIGNAAVNRLEGGAGNDTLDGGAGDDTLYGGTGDDTLVGGLGNDTLIGGLGDDTYSIDSNSDVITENLNEGTDTVNSLLAAYTIGNNLENARILNTTAANITGNALSNTIYAGTGNNVMDGADGVDTASYLYSAAAVNVSLAITAAQATGGSGSDTLINIENLTGSNLNDSLTGNTGNNILDGGKGADTLSGGLGNDIYLIDNSGDKVVESINEGTDTVYSFLTSYTLADNVENLEIRLTSTANATGNALNNIITGNIGNNILNGGLGADTLIGGAGNDTYYIDNTGDVITELANEGSEIVYSSLSSYTLGNNLEQAFINIATAANITGNELNNTIYAGAGDNVIDGANGSDLVDYVYNSTAGVTVSLAATGAQATGGSGSDTLLNIENIYGTDFNDTLTGNAGNNVLNGRKGADSLIGGAGNDTYYIDDAADIITEQLNEGSDTVYSSLVNYTLVNNLDHAFINIATAANITGNELNNTIYAGAGDNVIDGAGGADTVDYVYNSTAGVTASLAATGAQVTGGSGSDTLLNLENIYGSNFNDTLTGNAGNNVLNGRKGADSLIGGAGNDAYYVDNLQDTVTELANEGTDTVYLDVQSTDYSINYNLSANVENLYIRTNKATTVAGNSSDNTFMMGSLFSDSINGGLGSDTLNYSQSTQGIRALLYNGGSGNVKTGGTLTSPVNDGIDYDYASSIENIVASNFDDVIFMMGYAGINSQITGGKGNDQIYGYEGNDTYIFNRGDGADTIQESGNKSISNDTVKFSSNVSSKQLWFKQTNNDLDVMVIGTTDQIKIKDWYINPDYRVEQFQAGDGLTLLDSQVQNLVQAMAGLAPPALGQTTLPSNYYTQLNPTITSNWK